MAPGVMPPPYKKRPGFSTGGGMADLPKRGKLRGFALFVVLVAAALLGYTVWMLARPLYWRFYAEVIHRYESDAAQQLIRELQKETGERTDNFVRLQRLES
jgi:hypothetical protein